MAMNLTVPKSRKQVLRPLVIGLLLAVLVLGNHSIAYAASGDSIADRVLGQTNFTNSGSGSGLSNLNSPRGVAVDPSTGRIYVADRENNRVLGWASAASFADGEPATINITSDNVGGLSLDRPGAVAVDSNGNLYVADTSNNRVLQFMAPISSSTPASRVFGQPDFASHETNQGGPPGANTLNTPYGVVLDSSGNLYVADTLNNRVLKYTAPFSNGMAASLVLGQADFASDQANRNALPGANTLYWPYGMAMASSGTLYVADYYNHRVLAYTTPLGDGMNANLVLGQANFTNNQANRGGAAANTLHFPAGLAMDSSGSLYVGDVSNNRVLGYKAPFSTGMAATFVIGQADFTSSQANRGLGTPAANTLWFPYGVAADSSRNVYIADYFNNRILGYDTPWMMHQVYLPIVFK